MLLFIGLLGIYILGNGEKPLCKFMLYLLNEKHRHKLCKTLLVCIYGVIRSCFFEMTVPFINTNKTYVHFIYGAGNGNSKEAQLLYLKSFPP